RPAYGYRPLPDPPTARSLTARAGTEPASSFERAALGQAEVTIFTPLSGRAGVWPPYRDWLEAQTWPRGQCRLVLMDTSGAARFGRMVRPVPSHRSYLA